MGNGDVSAFIRIIRATCIEEDLLGCHVVAVQEKPEEPYDPQQTSTQRAGDPSVLKNSKIQGYSKLRNPDTQIPS